MPMLPGLVVATSLAFQVAAAIFAIRLMKVTGHRASWGLVAAGVLMMVMRRLILLACLVRGDANISIDMSIESISLAISMCLAAGLAGVGPMFQAMRRSEESLRQGENRLWFEQSRLEALLRLNQMTQASIADITTFALEEGVKLTRSQIGYLAFLNDDESVLTMHAWSKTAMEQCAMPDKPLVYQVAETGLWGEAVRQRQPVITNDYPAPNPSKKGVPDGHVPIRRHLNVPVFDGARIVAVAGVGNKEEPYEETDVRQLTLLMEGMWRLLQRRRAEEELHTAHQRLQQARDELELHVAQRTADLAAANEDLKLERYLLHSLMDNLPHNIYFKDAQSRFIRINRALANYFRLSNPAEALGKTDRDYFTSEHAQQAMADEQEIVRTGRPVIDTEEKETWPDGHVTWALTTKMPLYNEAGEVVGTFGISRDITEKRHAEAALRAAKEAAEAANRAKSTFLANMSHEIRTPLNAVIGMTDLVLKGQLSAQQREFLNTVRDSGEALLAVINDILDFSKIEAGKMGLDSRPFQLWESLGDTLKSFGLRAHQKGLELVCHIHPDVPRYVEGDYTRLRQIVVNLVGNAIKFTDAGEIVMEVACQSLSAEDVVLHCTISDTGIGIPSEKQQVIFGMFEQADASMSRRHGGTGLGLAIASRLAELMDGRIWVESEVGHGSRFHFTVRLGISQEPPPEPLVVEGRTLHGLPVLVVDDNATNRRILDEMLRGWNMVPTAVATAHEALTQLREAMTAGTPYPLLLADAQMPELDGFSLSRQIKQDPALANTVIIILTSGGMPEEPLRCADWGIAAHLFKPVKPSELLNGIGAALGIGPPQLTSDASELPPTAARRILLAEDSLVNQKLAVALLESRGHCVTIANTGRQALEAIESHPFDLVLMDVQMPEMDGLEATTAIRARETGTGTHIPIIAMTAHALSGDRERCLEVGMDSYIAKPVRATELFQAIDELFARLPSAPAPAPGVVDWSEAAHAVQGDQQVLRMVVEAAVEEIPQLMAAIRQAADEKNAQKLRIAAHTLKGSLRCFGAKTASEQVWQIETMARDEQLTHIRQAISVLELEIQTVYAQLSQYLQGHPRP